MTFPRRRWEGGGETRGYRGLVTYDERADGRRRRIHITVRRFAVPPTRSRTSACIGYLTPKGGMGRAAPCQKSVDGGGLGLSRAEVEIRSEQGERANQGCRFAGLIPRIQHFKLNTGSGSRVLMIKNWRKIYSWQKKFNIFLIKNCNLPIPRPWIYRRSLQLSKVNIQLIKTWNFLIFFLFIWIRIQSDPNPKHCGEGFYSAGKGPATSPR